VTAARRRAERRVCEALTVLEATQETAMKPATNAGSIDMGDVTRPQRVGNSIGGPGHCPYHPFE
jgi:hypothetical protein